MVLNHSLRSKVFVRKCEVATWSSNGALVAGQHVVCVSCP